MKFLERVAIILAAVSFVLTIIFKLIHSPLLGVQPVGMWRFTIVCLCFAIWARLAHGWPGAGEGAE